MPAEHPFNFASSATGISGTPGMPGSQHDDGGRPVLASQQRLQAMLRGRYVLLAFLMTVGGLTGGVLGFAHRHPIYRSTAEIQILPSTPHILYQTDQNGMVMFDQYVHTQMDLMKNDRVIDAALGTLGLRLGDPSIARQNILNSLNVLEIPNSELVQLTYDASDAATARAVVGAVANAFMNLYGDQNSSNDTRRILALQNDAENLNEKIENENADMRKAAGDLNPTGVQAEYTLKLHDLDRSESELTTAQTDLKTALAQQAKQESSPSVISNEDIAQRDAYMAQLLQQRRALEVQLAEHILHYGPNYESTMEIQAQLNELKGTIEEYARAFRQANPNAVFDAGAGTPSRTVEQRRAMIDALKNQRDADAQAVKELGPMIDKIQAITEIIKADTQHRDAILEELHELQVESVAPGRMSLISEGDLPSEAFKDPRRQWGIMGGICGAGSGFLIVLAIGSLDRRLRSSIDVRVLLGDYPLLGVLPELPPHGPPDQEQAALAMHCVHRVRTKLQIGHKSDIGRIIAITSAEPADGKTSVTMALGLAFAASRARTLLVDCDPTGRGLTRRIQVNLRRKLGQMLVRQHIITPEQRDEALRIARDTGKPLGEVLTQTGAAAAAAVQAALATQGQSAAGLFDVAAGEPLQQCISATGIDRLSVLPNAESGGVHTFALSPAVIRRILEQARQQFDVVLVDTGPIPGSIEATLFASGVDGVVLVASRGGRAALVIKAMSHLASVGANMLGSVFNRADENDVDQDSYQSKSRTEDYQAAVDQAHRHGTPAGGANGSSEASGANGGSKGSHEGRFGPLGWPAVLHAASSGGNGNGKRNGAAKGQRSRRRSTSFGGISAEELSNAIAEAFGAATDTDSPAPAPPTAQPPVAPSGVPDSKPVNDPTHSTATSTSPSGDDSIPPGDGGNAP